MKRILFYADIYWDIHWLHNVIRAMDGEVYTDREDVRGVCKHLGIKLAPNRTDYQIVVLTNVHLSGHNEISEYFLKTGGRTVLLQHAWDSDLHAMDRFWNRDMSRFSVFCVGSRQDYDWLSAKHGTDKIKFTGIPKLDDLYRVKNSQESVDDIYEKLGVAEFLLSIAPTDVITKGVYYKYRDQLEGETAIPVVFKCHPGGNHSVTVEQYRQEGKNFRVVEDSQTDMLDTYRLIRAARGVVCLESFIAIEASLMEKPVILYGYGDIPADFWNREENLHQSMRLSPEMSSTFRALEFKPKQREIADMYLFDGQNTDRVVNVLRELQYD